MQFILLDAFSMKSLYLSETTMLQWKLIK